MVWAKGYKSPFQFKKGNTFGFKKGNKIAYRIEDKSIINLIVKKYSNGESTKSISKSLGISLTPIYRILKENKIRINNKGFQNGQKAWAKDRKFTKEHCKKIGLGHIGQIPINKGKKFEEIYGVEVANRIRTIIKQARAQQIFPIKDTLIETKIQTFLKLLHIEFMTHYRISEITNAYQCDVYIPSIKTIIEADGCYWHGCSLCNKKLNKSQIKTAELDNIRTRELQEKGFRVIRLKEHEIKLMQLNKFRKILI